MEKNTTPLPWETIRMMRHAMHLKQVLWAKLLQVKQQTISFWENNNPENSEIGGFAIVLLEEMQKALEHYEGKPLGEAIKKCYAQDGILGVVFLLAELNQAEADKKAALIARIKKTAIAIPKIPKN